MVSLSAMKSGRQGDNMATGSLIKVSEDWRINPGDGKFLRVITANLAMDTLKRDQMTNRFPKLSTDYLKVVDNKLGASEFGVLSGGTIVYQNNSSTMDEMLAWIAEQLVIRSPYRNKRPQDVKGFRSSHYEDAHLYMVDGRAVMSIDNTTNIVSFRRNFNTVKHTQGSKHVFVNTMPYARRIEHGGGLTHTSRARRIKRGKNKGNMVISKTRSLAWSMQAPSGVYRAIERAAKARFGESVRIKYTRLQLSLPYKFGARLGMTSQFYPALVIRPKSVTKGVL